MASDDNSERFWRGVEHLSKSSPELLAEIAEAKVAEIERLQRERNLNLARVEERLRALEAQHHAEPMLTEATRWSFNADGRPMESEDEH